VGVSYVRTDDVRGGFPPRGLSYVTASFGDHSTATVRHFRPLVFPLEQSTFTCSAVRESIEIEVEINWRAVVKSN